MTDEIIEILILGYYKDKPSVTPQALAKHVSSELKRINSIKNSIAGYYSNIVKLQEECSKKCSTEHECIKSLRKTCKHECTKYHPDASGNNDSWTECLICGDKNI